MLAEGEIEIEVRKAPTASIVANADRTTGKIAERLRGIIDDQVVETPVTITDVAKVTSTDRITHKFEHFVFTQDCDQL